MTILSKPKGKPQGPPKALAIEGSLVESIENLKEAEESAPDRRARFMLIAARVLLGKVARGAAVTESEWKKFEQIVSGRAA